MHKGRAESEMDGVRGKRATRQGVCLLGAQRRGPVDARLARVLQMCAIFKEPRYGCTHD